MDDLVGQPVGEVGGATPGNGTQLGHGVPTESLRERGAVLVDDLDRVLGVEVAFGRAYPGGEQ